MKIIALVAAGTVAVAGGTTLYVTRPQPAPAQAAAALVRPAAVRPAPVRSVPVVPNQVSRRVKATPEGTVAQTVAPKPVTTVARPPFLTAVPAVPKVRTTQLGAITQNARVAGRDNGQSTKYGDRSVWIFDDTTMKNPWVFSRTAAP